MAVKAGRDRRGTGGASRCQGTVTGDGAVRGQGSEGDAEGLSQVKGSCRVRRPRACGPELETGLFAGLAEVSGEKLSANIRYSCCFENPLRP